MRCEATLSHKIWSSKVVPREAHKSRGDFDFSSKRGEIIICAAELPGPAGWIVGLEMDAVQTGLQVPVKKQRQAP